MGKHTITLASGREMPLVGYGLWKVPNDMCAHTVYEAIKLGYRLFDGAYDYTNEKEAGEGIQRAIKEGIVKREDVFVTTKLWSNYHSKEHALRKIKEQNEAWGLGYIDLFLIHFPIALEYIPEDKSRFPGWHDVDNSINLSKATNQETWEVMEEAVDLGIAKSIGVSNYSAQTLIDQQRYAKKPVSSLQIEHHPYLVQPRLIQIAKAFNIVPTAYSSYGPTGYRELGHARSGVALFENDVITSVSKAHSKSPAQVLLRWATQRGIAVIPKSNNVTRLKENLESLDFDLSEDEIKKISTLDQGLRFNDPADEGDPKMFIFA